MTSVQILKDSLHQHTVHFVDYTEEIKPCLVMEYLSLGNLAQQHKESPVTAEEVVVLLSQSLQALAYMHFRGTAHRDIKPENILFQSRQPMHIKLADFGLASTSSVLRTHCGTWRYSAPEIWSGDTYTPAVDIWSLGVVVFEYAYGLPPYKGANFSSEKWYVKLLRAVEDWESDGLLDFLSSYMLVRDVKARKSALECAAKLEDISESLPPAKTQVYEETPTEIISSSSMMAAMKHLEQPDDLDRQSPVEKTIDHNQTEEPTIELIEESGERQKSLKRRRGNDHGKRSEYVQMKFLDIFVSLRKHDSWLNATEIMILAELDAHRRGQILEVMTRHTTVEEESVNMESLPDKTFWVCFEHGRYLAQALGLSYTLRRLLRHHQQHLTFDEDQVRRENYLIGYIRVHSEGSSVMIRKLDFRVNGTHITKLAGKDRQAMVAIRKSGISFDIVSGKATYAGTYVSLQYGLQMCDEYGLQELKNQLLSARESNRVTQVQQLRLSANRTSKPQQTMLASQLPCSAVQRKLARLQQDAKALKAFEAQPAADAEQMQPFNVPMRSASAADPSTQTPPVFIMEPFFSKDSSCPQLRESVLGICPDLNNEQISAANKSYGGSPSEADTTLQFRQTFRTGNAQPVRKGTSCIKNLVPKNDSSASLGLLSFSSSTSSNVPLTYPSEFEEDAYCPRNPMTTRNRS